ncbi:hypothetical protein GF396_04765 [Candidatus Pacearchaeota archaeon]|nr:hypothetical protein [Candidatus Pacearchaeota archaeon]
MGVRERLDDIDGIVRRIYARIVSNFTLMGDLQEPSGVRRNRDILEEYVLDHLSDFEISEREYSGLFIRDEVLYELQIREGIDFGLCGFFYPPNYREKRLMALNNDLESLESRCTIDGQPQTCYCNGFDAENCPDYASHLAYCDWSKQWNPNDDPDFDDLGFND